MIEPVIAKYRKDAVFPNNPYINALPERLSNKAVKEALLYIPEISTRHMELSLSERMSLSSLITQFYFPSDEIAEIYQTVYSALIDSYKGKGATVKNCCDEAGTSFSVTGPSGIGKTTAIKHILSLFPRVIKHPEGTPKQLVAYQITYIHIEMPPSASLKGLCIRILSEIDEAIGESYLAECTAKRYSGESMMPVIQKACKAYGVGIIIIDEVQNIVGVRSEAAENILSFLTQLVNIAHTSICFLGTLAANKLFLRQLCIARRADGVQLSPMAHGREFTLAVRAMWGLLVTSPSTILTQALIDKLFDVSYGFIGRASSILRKTQEYLIVSGKDETITPEAIDFVVDRYFANSGEYVNVMKSGKLAAPEGMSMRDLPE
ncbi:MAG TPA: ATP-binding protein [Clostridia bacterium]|nr:ATP-binding protein [Clostridia bacterium]